MTIPIITTYTDIIEYSMKGWKDKLRATVDRQVTALKGTVQKQIDHIRHKPPTPLLFAIHDQLHYLDFSLENLPEIRS